MKTSEWKEEKFPFYLHSFIVGKEFRCCAECYEPYTIHYKSFMTSFFDEIYYIFVLSPRMMVLLYEDHELKILHTLP
jgi:hypothetical protein